MINYDSNTALIVVDMQVDFALPQGSLYVKGGEELIPLIATEVARAKAKGALVVYTQDWHPEKTPHFDEWPVHCVQNTPGAEIVDFGVHADSDRIVIQKGQGQDDGYSGFQSIDLGTREFSGTELYNLLDERDIRDVIVVGLAGDYCVEATAIDGMDGFEVTVPLSLTKFVNKTSGDDLRAIGYMSDRGVRITY